MNRQELLIARDVAIKTWGTATVKETRAQMARLNIMRHTGRLNSNLRMSYGRSQSNLVFKGIDRLGLKMLRHGVFIQKGVGRGYPLSGKRSSLGKRKPKDWFNQVIDRRLPGLADELLQYDATIVANNLFID